MIIFIIISSLLSITTTIVLYNFFSAPKLKEGIPTESFLVSILIPARNEENNISKCLDSILKQDYKNFEVLVLDDESEDKTSTIIKEYVQKDKRVQLLQGGTLPADWIGKNWACYQLSQKATGDYFLFLDADTTISKNVLSKALYTFIRYELSLLSIFPTQIINSLGEYLVVPLMNWILLTLLPLKFVYTKKGIPFTAANGQFMLFDNNVYKEIGGHKAVFDKTVEDMELARIIKQKDYRIMTCLGNNDVYCKMYNSLLQGINGFSKNFFPGFNSDKITFFLFILLLFLVYVLPFLIIYFNNLFIIPVLLIILQRVYLSSISKQNIILNIILHPFQLIVMFITGIRSILSATNRKLIWKGRRL